MSKFKKIYLLLFFILIIPNSTFAVSLSDANRIFDSAEQEYPQFLSPKTNTNFYEEWIYRYYSSSGFYFGINTSDEVYLLLNGEFGYVGTVQEVQRMLGINNSNEINWVNTWLVPLAPYYTTGWRYTLHSNGMGLAHLYQYQDSLRQWTPISFDQTIIHWSFLDETLVITGLSFNERRYSFHDIVDNERRYILVFDEVFNSQTAFIECLTSSCSDVPEQ